MFYNSYLHKSKPFVLFFFFFNQKTAYDMLFSDWSSDVCSSDLRQRPTCSIIFFHLYICRELRIRTLACCDIKRISLSSHGAVHFHHRRRGFLAWQRPYGGKPCSIAAGAGLSCAHSEVRSLSERRSGHDVALSAW